MFKRKTPTQLRPSSYPPGTFIQTENGYFYVQSPVKRFRFLSKRVLDSWSPQRVIVSSEADPAVEKLKVTSKMKFRNGSLLYSHANGKMYLISENLRRPITNPYWLEYLGASLSDAVWVSKEEINLHEEGEPLT